MSDEIEELDCWEPRIQCENPGSVWLQSEEIERHDDEIPAQVAVEASRGRVRVSVSEGEPDSDTIAGATVYVAPDEARDLAERLQDNQTIRFNESDCCWWLRMGWLAHDGPSRSDESTVAELEWACGSLSAVVSQNREDVSGTLLVGVEPTETEQQWMIEKLYAAAATADDHEPVSIETSQNDTSSGGRPLRAVVSTLLTGGAALGLSVWIFNTTVSALTINGEQLGPAGIRTILLVIVLLLISASIVFWILPNDNWIASTPRGEQQ